jgi:hypothetical protein
MIGDAPIKMRQTIKKTHVTLRAVPDSGFIIVKNPPKRIQIPPTIFSSDVCKQFLIANDRNRVCSSLGSYRPLTAWSLHPFV